MRKISKMTRREIIGAVSERYRSADRADKGRLLDEFVSITGYHRRHAVRLLGTTSAVEPSKPLAPRSRKYDEPVNLALTTLGEASDRICGKRLVALLPLLIPALEKHGGMQIDPAVRNKLLSPSSRYEWASDGGQSIGPTKPFFATSQSEVS